MSHVRANLPVPPVMPPNPVWDGVGVALYLARTDLMAAQGAVIEGCLAAGEVRGWAQVADAVERDTRLLARALLRQVLASRMGVAPATLRFESGAGGKPQLAADQGGWHFSVAHSRGLAAVAVARVPVGVDVETPAMLAHAVPPAQRADLARTLFSPQEQTRLAQAEDPAQAFLALWVAREAVLKVDGRGWVGARAEVGVPALSHDWTPLAAGIPWQDQPLPAWAAAFDAGGGARGALSVAGPEPAPWRVYPAPWPAARSRGSESETLVNLS